MKCEHCKDTTCSKRKTAGECTYYGTLNIEIPFGARDSELGGFEYTIPEGFGAKIKDGKVIVKKAESEDEKFLRYIIDCCMATIKSGDKGLELSMGTTKRLLAWLEKQGEQKKLNAYIDKLASDTIYNDENGNPIDKDLMAFASKVAFSMIPATKTESYHHLNRSRISDAVIKGAQWEKEQGEQKPKNNKSTNIEVVFDPITGNMSFYNLTSEQEEKLRNALLGEQKPNDDELEKFKDKLCELFQRFRWFIKDEIPTNGVILEYVDAHAQELLAVANEQKPADKVEHKFEVGDWVVTSYGKVNQVVAVDKDGYGYTLDDGVYFSGSWRYVYHLWTIQDAKEGDVLYSPKGVGVEAIFLIKGWKQVEYTGKTLCSSIVYRVEEDKIVVGGLGAIWWDGVIDPFYPATKEQRDLLFQKMHEAGYEWDAEKKELKKIEQKPAWSEEDEKMCQDTIQFIETGWTDNGKSHLIPWLKSLKERVQPQPKQEWSEEDEKNLYHINALIKDSSLNVYRQEHLSSWLASFKQKKHWKPSDEQIKSLQESIGIVGELTPRGELLKELLEQLKKLREE